MKWTLLAPLSHIGESVGPDSYLATQEILGPDGMPTEVFVYSGNAIRGTLRDAGAKYFQDHLIPGAIAQAPLELFYLLWSGGSIGGDQKLDIEQAQKLRQMVPHLSILGGGIGNQILPGKLNVGDGYPLCKETQHLIPEELRDPEAITWRAMTAERSYTRTDDAKDENKRTYYKGAEEVAQLPGGEQLQLLADSAEEAKRQEKRDKQKDRPQQMRYMVEVLQAGARLWSEITFFDCVEVELGALVACFEEWGKRPVLGGKSNVGMGKVKLDAKLQLHGQAPEPFVTVDGRVALGNKAVQCKDAYDAYLRKYGDYLEENREGLVSLIGA